MPGRLAGDSASRALVAGDVAIGVGWGGTASVAVTAGSNDQRGEIVITASATTPAQATSTVVITFAQPFQEVPFGVVIQSANDEAATVQAARDVVATKTTLAFKSSVVPVAAKIYKYVYQVL
jgi:F420-0:gamma-glutamyl ligase